MGTEDQGRVEEGSDRFLQEESDLSDAVGGMLLKEECQTEHQEG
jgi:hypothetical protein